MQGQQLVNHVTAVAESMRTVDDLVRSSIAASTTGAVAAVRQPRGKSALRRGDPRENGRRGSSDVVVTATKHVSKPWRHDRALNERRGQSQTGEGQGGELRLTHDRLQQYAAAHARLTAPARTGPRSNAGSTLLRKVTNVSALLPSPPQQPPAASSPTGLAGGLPVRVVASAPLLSHTALAGSRLALTNHGIPLPGMGAPTGARPASARRPVSPHMFMHRLGSFHQPQQLHRQVNSGPTLGAPPPERAFGPRAADYPSRANASPRPIMAGGGAGGTFGLTEAHHPHPHPHHQSHNKPPAADAWGGPGRARNGAWPSNQPQLHQSFDSPYGSPHRQGGWDDPDPYSPGSGEAAGPGGGQESWQDPPAPPVLHHLAWQSEQQQLVPQQQQQTQQQQQRLRPLTPRSRRPQSSGPGARPGAAQAAGPGRSGDMVVVGLRDVPPSQLPHARAVMEAGGVPAQGQGQGRSSDDGTHASWWQAGCDSEASFPMTAVTDRNVGEDQLTPSEAALWLGRMAELEAEVLEERGFRRKYEEELQLLAAATTGGGRGGRPPGGGPALWQTTGGRVLTGARAAAAAVMRHRADMPS